MGGLLLRKEQKKGGKKVNRKENTDSGPCLRISAGNT